MTESTRAAKIKAVIRVAAGNFLEMYDFMVFGYYAAAIGRTFFPRGNEFAQLMSAFATFGVGFLMRPLGALVLGSYIDKNGRRKQKINCPLACPLGAGQRSALELGCPSSSDIDYAAVEKMRDVLVWQKINRN